jgi:Transposase DDE domain.
MIGTELRKQIITSSKLRRGPNNDNIDFIPIARKADSFKSIGIAIGDKAFDDESNHVFLRDKLNALSIIPARNENIPIWRTKGKYRKEMKRGYSKKMYHQRSKVETVFYVIKKTMGDDIKSIKTKAQNNEMRFKIIAYNAARIASLAYSLFRGFLQSLGKRTFIYSEAGHTAMRRQAIKKDLVPNDAKSHRARNQSVLEPELKGKECTTSMESERGQEAAQKTLSHTP